MNAFAYKNRCQESRSRHLEGHSCWGKEGQRFRNRRTLFVLSTIFLDSQTSAQWETTATTTQRPKYRVNSKPLK
ncbi:hypothetical protein M404DRAFT_716486 [Pisolithus tinctorius Marx 270]|uniref:Uncharacterized protein n=1 Tax=Pisolithus tinctorius Marx 270 TaxID=870435 RepID=A0A0C3NBA5_PISTI|nr:hypothetical protein M404DRAFT_716486 [Pisolithus tinctorius Marx 270]